jgi:two-component system, LytTR family, response regulator
MNTIKAIIIDDEELSQKNIEKLVSSFCPDVTILSCFESAFSAMTYLRDHPVDLVFLDISMPLVTGFDFLKALPFERTFETVFVTAYEEYAIKAIKVGAIDYIMKPISVPELQEAVRKVRTLRYPKEDYLTCKKISVSHSKGVSIFDFSDILYLESDRELTMLHLVGNQKLTSSKNLKEFEEALDGSFYRTHKSFLINLTHIQGYCLHEGGQVIMKNNAKLPISRRKTNEFVETLKHLAKPV